MEKTLDKLLIPCYNEDTIKERKRKKMKKSIFKSVISTICAIFCGIFTFCLLNGEIDITTIIGSVGFLVVSICATIGALEDAHMESIE